VFLVVVGVGVVFDHPSINDLSAVLADRGVR
jgi:hypothetical protein